MRANLSAHTERSVLKLGTGYKGNSNIYRSIGQNVLITSNSYNYRGGFFGDNSKHGGKSTRNISSEDNLKTANDFYSKIAYGGIEKVVNNNLRITRMNDGTVITMRVISHSDGTPVVDVNIKNSTHTGGVKTQKIHFVQEDTQ